MDIEDIDLAKFTISAYQEMFADEEIEAINSQEALLKFQAMLSNGEVTWRPSSEDMDFTVSEADNTGRVISDVSSDSLSVLIRA